MARYEIHINKENSKLIMNENEKKMLSQKINSLIPELLEELREEQYLFDFPNQILVSTKSIPKSIKRNMFVKHNKEEVSYPKIVRNMIVELDDLKMKSSEKRILDKIERSTEIQIEYYKETIYQINNFLKSLE